MDPYYQDGHATLFHGKALDVTRSMPDESVNCVVTSPPYFGLRDYGHEDQYGTEETPGEYIENMVRLYREVRRVLTDDGTFWLNVGDSYYSGRGNPGPNGTDPKNLARRGWNRQVDKPGQPWGQRKGMLGIPWRVALALQDDGWILRNDIIWAKPNAMPEPVADRLNSRHEHLFLFAKSSKYWFDLDPIREPLVYPDAADGSRVFGGRNKAKSLTAGSSARRTGRAYEQTGKGRNPGDVWSISTSPFPGAHFATFPEELPRRCIASGCKPGGVVLDPCSGSGTTGAAAQALGRRYIGIDINADYLKLSLETRLRNAPLDLTI